MVEKKGTDAGNVFMNAVLVAIVKKNSLEEIRISVLKNNKIDFRVYFYFPNDPLARPTKKGVWLSFKHIPPILAAFDAFLKDPKQEFKLEFDETEKNKIVAYLSDFKGAKVVHIRTFYLKHGEFLPGRGVSFSATVMKDMYEAIKKLETFKE
jgi:hypothetical protein